MARYLVMEFPNDDTDERIDLWLKGFPEDIVLVASNPLYVARWAIDKALALENDG